MRRAILVVLIVAACRGQKTETFKPDFNTSAPPVLVYKTKADYSQLVPVLLSDDKTEIVSYPHPTDLKTGSGYPLPAILHSEYLLDNRGINKNVAFIKLTYQEYAKLEKAPSLKELYSLIIDKDPLNELCNCGTKNAFSDVQKQVNLLIDKKTLKSVCKVIK
jgi:hypothetical protein